MTLQKLCATALMLGALSALPVIAQTSQSSSSASKNAPPANTGGGQPPAQTLTAEQLAKVKSVLAAYKPATLTAEDAKTIKRTFRDAGIRPGPAISKALSDAGFSAEKLDTLAPPPPRPANEGGGPPPQQTPAAKK